jgi:hypothetical protein
MDNYQLESELQHLERVLARMAAEHRFPLYGGCTAWVRHSECSIPDDWRNRCVGVTRRSQP